MLSWSVEKVENAAPEDSGLLTSAGFSSELGDVISVLILLATRVAMTVASSSGQFLFFEDKGGERKKHEC